MDNQEKESVVLFKATAQGYSIIIHGLREEGGLWKCSIEENEITYSDTPKSQHIASLGEKRNYKKTEFTYQFEEAFKKIAFSEWFLCHPEKLHADFAEFVMKEFYRQMDAHNNEFPVDTPMEEFLRSNKVKEWKAKVDASMSPEKT